MRKILTLIALSFTIASNAQWIEDTSCNKNAEIVVNQAIEYTFNLEYMAAFGSANSALLLDKNCGCAKLVLAYISSSNKKWGSREAKLNEINTSKLSSEEKAWYDYMLVSSDELASLEASLLKEFPTSPLMNFLGTSMQDFNTFKTFAKKFPEYSSSAYNMISYGYMNGAYGEKDVNQAIQYAKMSQDSHAGPNAYDSMAEHYASMGDYENALKTQLKAIDFGTFASPYRINAQRYYAKTAEAEISEEIMAYQKEMQKAILEGDYEAYKKFEHPEITVSTGDSNLSPFYVYTKKDIMKDSALTWDSFTLSDMETYFSPDMKTAVVTFVADGSFTIAGTDGSTVYATRASSTWNNTDDGWKILHSSFAPRKGKNGLPEVD